MSANDKTKYYWLKLSKDFFQKHQIRVIEGMPNGKEYVLFYLKLMVEATSWQGELRFSPAIPYNEQMLANLTSTPIDTVHTAMELFRDLKLIEILDDGTLYIEEVKRITGSETGKAIRDREYRERLKTGSNQAQTSLEIRDKRLEIRDKSIEVTTDYTNVPSSVTKIKPDKTRYKQTALLRTLMDSGYISEDEIDDGYDGLLNYYVREFGYVDTKVKLKYFLSVICHLQITGEDKDGKPIFSQKWKDDGSIANRYRYFEKSMDEAFDKTITVDEDDELF